MSASSLATINLPILSLPDAVVLPGMVVPIELDDAMQVVERARQHGSLDIANLNSPTQVVISGERTALDMALRILAEEHYVEAVVIERRIPMHSSHFRPVQAVFRAALEAAPTRQPCPKGQDARRLVIEVRIDGPLRQHDIRALRCDEAS